MGYLHTNSFRYKILHNKILHNKLFQYAKLPIYLWKKHGSNHFLSLKEAESQELINAEVTKNEELQNKLDDLEYEVTKFRMKNAKYEASLSAAQVNNI